MLLEQIFLFHRIAYHLVHHLQLGFPVRRNRVHEREEIGDANVINTGRIQVWRFDETLEYSVATIAASIDAHALWIGDSLLNDPVHSIGDVILHRTAPLFKAGFKKFSSVAGRSPEIHLINGIAPISSDMDLVIKFPIVARPRSAVWIDHNRQIFWIAPFRQR